MFLSFFGGRILGMGGFAFGILKALAIKEPVKYYASIYILFQRHACKKKIKTRKMTCKFSNTPIASLSTLYKKS